MQTSRRWVFKSELRQVRSPLRIKTWTGALHDHPGQRFASYLISGLHKGFRNRDSKLRRHGNHFNLGGLDTSGRDTHA